jgi:peroxiredoxin
VVGGPGPSIDGWIEARSGAELVAVGAAAAAIFLASVAARLWRDNRELRDQIVQLNDELAAFPAGLPVGAKAPDFSLASVHGGAVTLDALLARGTPVALMFVSPGCGPCGALFTELGRWQSTFADRLTVAAVSTGSRAENIAVADGADILLQEDDEVMRAYRVWGSPAAVVVNADGTIASAPASGSFTIEALIRLTLRRGTAAAHASRAVAATQPVA